MTEKTFYRNCREQGIFTTMEECKFLRNKWLEAFPEMVPYLVPKSIGAVPLSTFKTKKVFDEEDEDDVGDAELYVEMYEAVTTTGRWRRNCTFSSALNYPFQALASDAVKNALWLLYKEGIQLCNFVHDEVIFYVPEDPALYMPIIQKVCDLMIKGASEYTPHIELKVEPALMRVWSKKAEPVYDAAGLLTVWEPETAA